jgi:hypothetical protein
VPDEGVDLIAVDPARDPTGTPFGIQIVGRNYADRFTLGLAHALGQVLARDAVLELNSITLNRPSFFRHRRARPGDPRPSFGEESVMPGSRRYAAARA